MTWDDEYERWRKEVASTARTRRTQFETASGIPIPEVSKPRPIADIDDLGFPGAYPYTRGPQATMYRGRHWTMRQYAGFGTAKESNERYHYLLGQGQKALSVAFDLPTQMGFDSDAPEALGEVGRVGVAIDTIDDIDLLFHEIPLDQVSTSMTINATAATLLGLYVTTAKRRGIALTSLRGTIQNDILKEYIARGTWIYPPRASMRLVTDTFAWCQQHLPKWNTISISGYHVREAGCTAVQEVAFTLANAVAYCEAAIAAGLEVDEFAPRLSFFFNVHNDFLEEIAKFRAARRLWARIMKNRFGAKNERSQMLRFHTQTAGSSLTAQQPDNNIVRVALQAMAAVLGGTQSLHTNSRDEALALPSQESVRIALRTQQVIAHESGVADHVDPLAGSYVIEDLTDAIEAGARDYIERIDGMGGMVAAIEEGYVQREIQDAAYRYQKQIESGDRVVVGVNEFTVDEEPPTGLLRVDARVEREQVERLRLFRKARSTEQVDKAIDRIRRAADSSENIVEAIVEGVEAGATLGEVANAMRSVFGRYHEVLVV